ncbi:DUF1642 domain-containing protein [Enterococcus sp. 3C7_DIV0644]|uniref:DUF1642 domain-containing protein n=1 Tax=Enterococcus sp. 3C7_DIV0644 TaxID=1834174 RepID=UPI000A33414E|nr:DUF1642 domain-containing protein [Enterococcus sp. 3C7_DIV0644]OTO27405.1 hypothetical protein A5877_002970 [Enterococcus sp. 3C7_DIV0644]
MNKQELINSVKAWGAWCTDHNTGEKDRYVKIDKVRELIEQLDGKQKVTVPKFVAIWIKQCQEKATLADCLDGYYEISNGEVVSSEDFQSWVADNENDELTAKAWMFGYEVESVLWIVKLGKTYFRDFDNYCGDLIAIPDDGLDAKKHAFKFDDKSKALKVADEIGGIVEEVK